MVVAVALFAASFNEAYPPGTGQHDLGAGQHWLTTNHHYFLVATFGSVVAAHLTRVVGRPFFRDPTLSHMDESIRGPRPGNMSRALSVKYRV